jgi:hypothetical protein
MSDVSEGICPWHDARSGEEARFVASPQQLDAFV